MRICYLISALIVVICRQEGITGNDLKNSHTIDSHAKARNKRGLMLQAGKKAITELFQAASRVYSNGYDDIFVRKGGLQQAEKDFMKIMSVNPKAFKEKKTKAPTIVLKKGTIGRRIRVKLEQRSLADPTLTVTSCELPCYKFNQKPFKKTIVYTD